MVDQATIPRPMRSLAASARRARSLAGAAEASQAIHNLAHPAHEVTSLNISPIDGGGQRRAVRPRECRRHESRIQGRRRVAPTLLLYAVHARERPQGFFPRRVQTDADTGGGQLVGVVVTARVVYQGGDHRGKLGLVQVVPRALVE